MYHVPALKCLRAAYLLTHLPTSGRNVLKEASQEQLWPRLEVVAAERVWHQSDTESCRGLQLSSAQPCLKTTLKMSPLYSLLFIKYSVTCDSFMLSDTTTTIWSKQNRKNRLAFVKTKLEDRILAQLLGLIHELPPKWCEFTLVHLRVCDQTNNAKRNCEYATRHSLAINLP